MSKLLENKQIIHIATEIVVLIGITFYFSSKNKKLLSHIEDLSQRLEDQEDLIQKHEQIIKQLFNTVNNLGNISQPINIPIQSVTSQKPKNIQKSKPIKEKKKISTNTQKIPVNLPKVNFNNEVNDNTLKPQITQHKTQNTQPNNQNKINKDEESIYEISNSSSDNDSDLDAEIADELEDLEEQDGLKKRT